MTRILSMLTAALLAAAGPAGAETVRLQYRYPHGQQLHYRLDIEQRVKLNSDLVPELTRRVVLSCGCRLTCRVERVDESGSADLQLTYLLLQARQAEAGQVNRLADLERLPPLRVRVRRDRQGRGQASLPPEQPAGGRLEGLAAALHRAQQLLALEFPAAELAAGQRWTIERRLQLPLFGGGDLELVMQGDYRLQRLFGCRHQRCARISAGFTVRLSGGTGLGEFRLQADLQGRGQARYLFGVDSGTLLRAGGRLRVAGRLDARAGQDTDASKLEIAIQTTTELVD